MSTCASCNHKVSALTKLRLCILGSARCPNCGASLSLSKLGAGACALIGFFIGRSLLEADYNLALALLAGVSVALSLGMLMVSVETKDVERGIP